jgi:cell division protein FtsQ
MAGMASVSRKQLQARRHKLRRQRQMKILKAGWRTLAVCSLVGILLWGVSQPIWVLSTPQQIAISGNRLLSPTAIQSLIAVSYPQSLWRIEPTALAQALQKQAPIQFASVSRRLFPPGLIVHVQERLPVAIAQTSTLVASSPGLLDENGVWIPLENYKSSGNITLPSLKVIGVLEQYRPHWKALYQEISHSQVNVLEIDYRDLSNLILKTELGQVHLGADSSQLKEQLLVLAKMKHLPAQLVKTKINYIDLKNPRFPIVQMNQDKRPVTKKSD